MLEITSKQRKQVVCNKAEGINCTTHLVHQEDCLERMLSKFYVLILFFFPDSQQRTIIFQNFVTQSIPLKKNF